jgi:hypothetical protein
MQQQVLELKNKFKEKKLDRRIRICMAWGSTNARVNQYGIFCKNCGFLWDFKE